MQRRTANLLALAALGALGTAPALAQKQKPDPAEITFATPEGAVAHIVETLRRGDLAAALMAFGIDRQVRDYSFVKMATRLNAISLSHNAPPVRFPFYGDIARARFTSDAATQLRNLAYSLLAPVGTALDTIIAFTDGRDMAEYAGELEAALDPARLGNLRLVRTATPNAEAANSENYLRVMAAQLAVTGGDELQERFALLDLNGRTFRSGMSMVRYGERWLVRGLVANLGGTSAAGYAEPITEAEFDAAVS